MQRPKKVPKTVGKDGRRRLLQRLAMRHPRQQKAPKTSRINEASYFTVSPELGTDDSGGTALDVTVGAACATG